MSEEVKKEATNEEIKEVKKTPEVKVEEKEEKETEGFNFDSSDDELPEEIKQKLEKNKQARAKKKLIKKKLMNLLKIIRMIY